MKLIWELLTAVASGWIAVNILHLQASPSYLMLAIGWLALVSCLASAGSVLNAVFGIGEQKCTCSVCARHRQEISA
jgi:hypothetical protein